MDLKEAQEIINAGYTLSCGHTNSDIKDDYYCTYCGACGTAVDRNEEMSTEYKLALEISSKVWKANREHKQQLKANILERMDEMLSVDPRATLEDFSIYLSGFCEGYSK